MCPELADKAITFALRFLLSAAEAQGALLLSYLHEDLHCADRLSLQRALEATPIGVLAAGGAVGAVGKPIRMVVSRTRPAATTLLPKDW